NPTTGNLAITSASHVSDASARTLVLDGTATGNTLGTWSQGTGGSGTLFLTKQGTGKWTITGANTYTGTTTISGGTLSLDGGDNRLPSAGALTFTGSSALNVAGISQTLANVTVNNGVTGTIAGSGGTLNINGGSNIIIGN